MSDNILFYEIDGLAMITFNRPDVMNTIGLEDILAIDSQLRRWRNDSRITGVILRGDGLRAFSAGEDLEEIYQALERQDDTYLTALLRGSHRLIQLWASYPKPTMAVMSGITTGLGASLAMAAAIRIVTELTLFSLPQCRLGLVPDAGAAFYLAKCPGKIGLFLALAGMEIRAPGMLHAGLGTHYVPPQDVDFVNFTNLDVLSMPLPNRPLAAIQPEIDRCFDQRSVDEIETVLAARPAQGFRDILGQVQRGAPLALALTYRHVSGAVGRSLEDILKESYRLNRRLMQQGDVKEGIRAQMIDKDGKPAWLTQAQETRGTDLADLFAPLSREPELYFDAS